MAEETEGLQEAIRRTVYEWHAANGGGFPLSMICVVDRIDANGEPVLSIAELETQPTHRSMGLVAYLAEWYRDDAQQQMLAQVFGEAEDED